MAGRGGGRTAAAGNIGGIGATKSPSSLDSPLIHNHSRRGGGKDPPEPLSQAVV